MSIIRPIRAPPPKKTFGGQLRLETSRKGSIERQLPTSMPFDLNRNSAHHLYARSDRLNYRLLRRGASFSRLQISSESVSSCGRNPKSSSVHCSGCIPVRNPHRKCDRPLVGRKKGQPSLAGGVSQRHSRHCAAAQNLLTRTHLCGILGPCQRLPLDGGVLSCPPFRCLTGGA